MIDNLKINITICQYGSNSTKYICHIKNKLKTLRNFQKLAMPQIVTSHVFDMPANEKGEGGPFSLHNGYGVGFLMTTDNLH